MRATAITAACLFLLVSASAQQGKAKTSAVPSGKAVLEAYVSAWNRHDFAALDKHLTPDAVHEDLAQGVHAQGLAEIKKFMREEIEGEPDLDWRLTTMMQAGPVVAAEWTWTGTFTGDGPTGPVKGQRISGRGASVVVTENGRIKRFTDYYDFASFFPKGATAEATTTQAKAQDSASESANNVEGLLKRMEQDWTTAEINKDMAAFDRLLADDWIQIDWEGKTDTKKQWLQFVSSPDFKITTARIVEMKVRPFGNVAIVTGVNEEKSTSKGKDTSGRYAWTDTYANRNGHWQAVASQVTPVPSSEPSQGSAEKYIRESEAQWAEAVANGDVSVVQRILSDDFIGVDAGDGHLYPKAEAISWIQGHHAEYLFNHVDEVKVRFFGDTAVAQGSESWERRSGTPRKGRFVWTDTWVLRNGQWQIVAAEDLIAGPLPAKNQSHKDGSPAGHVLSPTLVASPSSQSLAEGVKSLDAAEHYIRESEAEWADSVATGDVSIVKRILADDYVGVDAAGGTGGELVDKNEAVSLIRAHYSEFAFNRLDDAKIRFFGSTAVAQGSESWERRIGEPRKGRFVWTDTWVLKNGQWQIVASEDLIAPPLVGKTGNNSQQPSEKSFFEQEIISMEKRGWELAQKGDVDGMAALLSDDYQDVGEFGVWEKRKSVQSIAQPGFKLLSFSLQNFRFVQLTPTVVLLTYEAKQSGLSDGEPLPSPLFISSIWVNRQNKWLNVLYQDTPAAATTKADGKEVENHIVALEKRLWNGDEGDVSKLEADDIELIKHAHRYNRADDEAASKDMKVQSWSVDDTHVRVFAPDVALLTYRATQSGTFRGIGLNPSAYFGSLWVKREGEWKNVFLAEAGPDAFTDTYMPAPMRSSTGRG